MLFCVVCVVSMVSWLLFNTSDAPVGGVCALRVVCAVSSVLLRSFSAFAAPEGMKGALWVVSIRCPWLLGDPSPLVLWVEERQKTSLPLAAETQHVALCANTAAGEPGCSPQCHTGT